MQDQQNFKYYLRDELKKRVEANPNYSLRSFARYLGVSASGLSSLLSGKNPVSPLFIRKVAPRLKLSESQVQKYQLDILGPVGSKTQARSYQVIDQDRFEIIKEWYHYAILNLLRVKAFKPRASWVAKRLGISLGQVYSATERLQKVGLLRIDEKGWHDLSNQFTSHTNNKKFSEAARLNQIQFFEKALSSITEVKFEQRNHTGVTLALKISDLDRAKEKISQFRKEFLLEFDQAQESDEVYQVSVALFPLTNFKK